MTVRAIAILAAVGLWAGVGSAAVEPEYEMTTYQLVLLRQGPSATPLDERTIQRHQEEHLAFLAQLFEEGKALIEGPIGGSPDLRSVLVLDVGSVEAAEALMARDSWVEAGKLIAEIHPWYTAKGLIRKPLIGKDTVKCYLGLLKRPANAPDYPEERLREIQAGHMANIREMAASGDLALAGPLADDGPLRGIFVFRTLDQERIIERFKNDPANRAGRLFMELYPWRIPAGALPEQ